MTLEELQKQVNDASPAMAWSTGEVRALETETQRLRTTLGEAKKLWQQSEAGTLSAEGARRLSDLLNEVK